MPDKQKVAAWFKEHQEVVAVGTVYATIIGGVVILAVVSSKDQKKAIAAYNAWVEGANNWLNEQTAKGNYVYQLADGSYLTVASAAQQERVLL